MTEAVERFMELNATWTWEPFEQGLPGGFLHPSNSQSFLMLNPSGTWEAWVDGAFWIHPEGDSEAFVYFNTPAAAARALGFPVVDPLGAQEVEG
jgi:hypothetical protein